MNHLNGHGDKTCVSTNRKENNMKKRSFILVLTAILISLMIGPLSVNHAAAKKPITLDMVSFLNLKAFEFRLWKPLFIDKVNERAKGELKIRVRGGPEAIPIFDQVMAVKKGVVDMSNSSTGFFANMIPGIDCMRLSEFSSEEERKNGARDYIREVYRKAGLYYLGRVFPSKPYFLIFTNKKATKPDDFKGIKFGGAPLFHGFFKGLGGSTATIPLTEYQTAMERGVIDAHSGSIGVFIAVGSYEVTKYVIDHFFYSNSASILVNLDKWNSIPKHLQDIMQETAIELEKTWPAVREAEEAKLRKVAMKAGVQFYKLSPDVAKWYLDTAYEEGWKDDAKKYPAEIVNKFKTLLRK